MMMKSAKHHRGSVCPTTTNNSNTSNSTTSTNTHSYLAVLAPELLIIICRHLPVSSYLCMERTCRHIRSCLNSSSSNATMFWKTQAQRICVEFNLGSLDSLQIQRHLLRDWVLRNTNLGTTNCKSRRGMSELVPVSRGISEGLPALTSSRQVMQMHVQSISKKYRVYPAALKSKVGAFIVQRVAGKHSITFADLISGERTCTRTAFPYMKWYSIFATDLLIGKSTQNNHLPLALYQWINSDLELVQPQPFDNLNVEMQLSKQVASVKVIGRTVIIHVMSHTEREFKQTYIISFRVANTNDTLVPYGRLTHTRRNCEQVFGEATIAFNVSPKFGQPKSEVYRISDNSKLCKPSVPPQYLSLTRFWSIKSFGNDTQHIVKVYPVTTQQRGTSSGTSISKPIKEFWYNVPRHFKNPNIQQFQLQNGEHYHCHLDDARLSAIVVDIWRRKGYWFKSANSPQRMLTEISVNLLILVETDNAIEATYMLIGTEL